MKDKKWVKKQLKKLQGEVTQIQDNIARQQQILWELQVSLIDRQGKFAILQEILDEVEET